MNDQDFKAIYGISEQDKKRLIDRVSQDISWLQDELMRPDVLTDEEVDELDYE